MSTSFQHMQRCSYAVTLDSATLARNIFTYSTKIGPVAGLASERYSLILARILYAVLAIAFMSAISNDAATHSWSLNKWYSSSPTFTGLPPYYRTSFSILYGRMSWAIPPTVLQNDPPVGLGPYLLVQHWVVSSGPPC